MKNTLLLILSFPLFVFSQQTPKPVPNSINQFGLDLCKNLSDTPDYLISPASISLAMGMTYVGAQGVTKEEIRKVFHYPEDGVFYNGFADFIKVFESESAETKIALANKLWADRVGIQLKPEFRQKNSQYFQSDIELVDFRENEITRDIINKWVAENTANKIPELLDDGFISDDMVLILTNAVYFKSNWQKKFDSSLTHKDSFFNHQESPLNIDFMSIDGYFPSYEDNLVEVVELPYADGKFSFLIIMPKESMSTLEGQLTTENYNKWSKWLTNQKYELLKVPKFKVSSSFELKDQLLKMGMSSAFSNANFEGIGNSPNGQIILSKVAHETFMEFNEEGTEASAATAIGAVARSLPPPPKKLIVDRPFLYILRHIESNAMLFIGKMSNPVDESN